MLHKVPMVTGLIHTEYPPQLPYNCCSTMYTLRSLRSIAARPAARVIFRPQVSLSTFQHRNASSKHPKGFEAPTSEDLAELRERVQEFTRREITEEVAAKTDKSNSFPNEMWQKLGDAGFLGITADEDVGGLGMGYQAHCVVMEEISRYFNYMETILAADTH
jgi:isovaleryl-CoA dehydrogenase